MSHLLDKVIQAGHASSHRVGIPKVGLRSLHLNIQALTATQRGKAIDTEVEINLEGKLHLELAPLLLALATIDLIEDE